MAGKQHINTQTEIAGPIQSGIVTYTHDQEIRLLILIAEKQ